MRILPGSDLLQARLDPALRGIGTRAEEVDREREQVPVEDDELERLFEESVALRLTDESPEGKLLGVEIDMDHTR